MGAEIFTIGMPYFGLQDVSTQTTAEISIMQDDVRHDGHYILADGTHYMTSEGEYYKCYAE